MKYTLKKKNTQTASPGIKHKPDASSEALFKKLIPFELTPSQAKAIDDINSGFYELDGQLPCQPDGGLKCFGHPIGASGLRMLYEMYLQLQGKAGDRQIKDPKLGLTHNLGGFPAMSVCSVAIVGH